MLLSPCRSSRRISSFVRAGIVLGLLATLGQSAVAQTFVSPDHPDLSYTEFRYSNVSAERAQFDRRWVPYYGWDHAPGTRINFRTDATQIRFLVDYKIACWDDFSLGCGGWVLEVDGQRLDEPIGSDFTEGPAWFDLFSQPEAVMHAFSLVLPHGVSVEFLGMELSGGSELLAASLQRPDFLYVAYGDSITHGLGATSIAGSYPYRIGQLNDWSVVNMGFSGQIVAPFDAWSVGLLDPDLITLAIGTNDFWFMTSETDFKARYRLMLDNLRSFLPEVPIYVVTPTWVDYEDFNFFGTMVEDLRDYTRAVVFDRQRSDDNLYLIEGHDMVPGGLELFPDGIHPNDTGYELYARNLAELSLVRNPGFESDTFAWADWGGGEVVTDRVHSGAQALRIGSDQTGGRGQRIGGLTEGVCYRLSAWSTLAEGSDPAAFGLTFLDPDGNELAREEVLVTWSDWQQRTLLVETANGYAEAWVWGQAEAGASLYLDDFRLTEATCL